MPKYQDSIRGYGHPIHKKYNYICQYCGFDGRPFPCWLQLTIDHVIPRSCGGSDNDDNKVTACQACNSITSRMKFKRGMSFQDVLKAKRERIIERQKDFFEFWRNEVAPEYLKRWNTDS